MPSWVYEQSEKWTDEDGVTHVLFTVGFYSPDGGWHADSDHSEREEAAGRVAYLNGAQSCEHTADDNDLDFRCEADDCPVKQMTQRESAHYLAAASNHRVSQQS